MKIGSQEMGVNRKGQRASSGLGGAAAGITSSEKVSGRALTPNAAGVIPSPFKRT